MNRTTAINGYLYSRLANDSDLGELVEMFVSELPTRIQTLVEQSEAGDDDALRRSAHQLKGSAGSYGFDEITVAAGVLEHQLAAGGSPQDVANAFDALCSLCRLARAGNPLA